MRALLKALARDVLPSRLYRLLKIMNPDDLRASLLFLVTGNNGSCPFLERLRIVRQIYVISFAVDCPHRQGEVLQFISHVLALPPEDDGVIVEAGCYKGGSTSKFSLAAKIVGKKLLVFDSFQGLPDNNEPHDYNIFGEEAHFQAGDWSGEIGVVMNNVSRYGALEHCEFRPGWFENTLPSLTGTVSAAYIDVDLASSTRSCLRYIFPLLREGGTLFSQDGHLPLVIEVLDDSTFWQEEVRVCRPEIKGLGQRKLVEIYKETSGSPS